MPLERPDGYVDGPILNFVRHSEPFDAVYLLFDRYLRKHGLPEPLELALKREHPNLVTHPSWVPLDDVRAYDQLYHHMRAIVEKAQADYGPMATYHILLSPGTAQMHSMWVLLAKTVFPATCWQTSEHPNQSKAEIVDIPFDIDAELIEPARNDASAVQNALDVPDLVVRSDEMRRAVHQAQLAARRNTTILLLGETGVGKGRIARFVHDISPRRAGPFVTIQCAALPTELAESELFGYVKGAFTGATQSRRGAFERASGGTIFIDEIGDLPLNLQAKLLHVLQDRTIQRLGDEKDITVDVRVIAATHRPLADMVQEGTFRQDLYFRLSVIPIEMPPLRQRRDDILPLVTHFLRGHNAERKELGEAMITLKPTARQALLRYAWPGNVRELGNAVERLAVLAEDPVIDGETLLRLLPGLQMNPAPPPAATLKEAQQNYETSVRTMILRALDEYPTQVAAAQSLGLNSSRALQSRMRTHKIPPYDKPRKNRA